MASPHFPEPPPAVPATPLDEVDRLVDALAERTEAWVQTDIPERIRLMEAGVDALLETADEWVAAACKAKGITPGQPREGEEWLGGPMTYVRNLRLLIDSLKEKGQPKVPSFRNGPGGRKIAQVFPAKAADKLLYTGFTGEIWIQPGKEASQGHIYREKEAGRPGKGGVGLVLGAGNVASIGPMDALYKLMIDDEVVILKTNPVNAYLGPFIERAFKPFIDEGFFAIVHGGAEVGAHLCYHPKIASVHITGSNYTHDAIVWGSDPEERKRRMAADDPKLKVPISSELGAVTPVFVVPGEWSEKDLNFQARHVAGMVANNGSFNCNAAKTLVTASGWPQRERFIAKVKEQLAKTPSRKAYYPGAEQRYEKFLENYPQAQPLSEGGEEIVPWTFIPDVPASADEYALTNEAFCGVLADVQMDASNAEEFISKMGEFGNDVCWGTLSCMILIHPKTEKAHKAAFENALAELRYGGIGVNVWAGVIYGLVVTTWGAYPGHSNHDIQSGRGVVHNTYMFDHPEKSIVRAPFRISPTPPWFADNKIVDKLGRKLTWFEANPSLTKIPSVAFTAFKG